MNGVKYESNNLVSAYCAKIIEKNQSLISGLEYAHKYTIQGWRREKKETIFFLMPPRINLIRLPLMNKMVFVLYLAAPA